MKKIKHFKINIRTREVYRLLKSSLGADPGPDVEEAVERESFRIQKVVSLAALYDSLPKEKFLSELLFDPPDKWIAAGLFVVTAGDEIEREIKQAHDKNDETLARILHAVSVEALEQAENFVWRLMAEEAKEEYCELSRRVSVDAKETREKVLGVLPGDKIGIRLAENGAFMPLYSSSGISYWVPTRRRNSKN
ncbi:MAG: hypothetical protein JW803_04550 [Endomicrobiales bacterium]|nr:hypothetical protein [Endomicrobiales bacterium]